MATKPGFRRCDAPDPPYTGAEIDSMWLAEKDRLLWLSVRNDFAFFYLSQCVFYLINTALATDNPPVDRRARQFGYAVAKQGLSVLKAVSATVPLTLDEEKVIGNLEGVIKDDYQDILENEGNLWPQLPIIKTTIDRSDVGMAGLNLLLISKESKSVQLSEKAAEELRKAFIVSLEWLELHCSPSRWQYLMQFLKGARLKTALPTA